MDFSAEKSGEKEKKVFSPCMYKLPPHYFNLFLRARQENVHAFKGYKGTGYFYSLLTGADVSVVSDKYNISVRELTFIYKKSVIEISKG